MATLVVVWKDTLVKIVKQVYLNVFPDSSFSINSIYDHYWHITLFCNHLSLMKTYQFFVIRTPDLKQEGLICYWINTHFFRFFQIIHCVGTYEHWHRRFNPKQNFDLKMFLHLLETLKLKINKYLIITFCDSHLQILMSVILIHVKTADLAQIL